MNMTRAEAIDWFEQVRDIAKRNLGEKWTRGCEKHYQLKVDLAEAALTALRFPTREQVEKVWRGEWLHDPETGYEHCDKCSHTISLDDYLNRKPPLFCEMCGAPMTDEAVQMVMERLEALHGDR